MVPAADVGRRRPPVANQAAERRADALEPWQLFTLAGLIGATLVVFLARGQSPPAAIVLSLVIFAAATVGVAALRMVMPLTGRREDESVQTLGARARAALEREKALALRSIKELEFDHAMGKISEKDFTEMSARLRTRAAGLLRQVDAGVAYRETIEREIERRLTVPAAPSPPAAADEAHGSAPDPQSCAACETRNDADARFCKRCGAALRSPV